MLFKRITHIYFVIFIFSLFLLCSSSLIHAQETTATLTPTTTPDNSKAKSDLQDKINDLQSKIADTQKQGKTLSAQISVMDNQVKLTEFRIQSTEEQIDNLEKDISTATKKISNLEKSLDELTKVLLNRVVATYKAGSIDPLQGMVLSKNASDLFTKMNYLKIIQTHDKQLLYETQQAKTDYANQKNIFEDKKKKVESLKIQLEQYTKQLETDKKAKQVLLAETQGSEANYQRLLNEAKAQLAGFSRFVSSQGGASILSGQTKCDDWGCYYNQRDSQWGSNALNGTQYTLASDGCLVTSMAMVYTHYGSRGVTPSTINSISSNFASYYPAYLNFRIIADGKSSERTGTAIDSSLSNGDPVVVGVHAYGGTHFVVLVSGSGGNYLMHDPFVPNGAKVSFTEYYSMGSIFSVQKVVFY